MYKSKTNLTLPLRLGTDESPSFLDNAAGIDPSMINFSVSVSVEPIYLEEQSSPAENHFVWAYHIRITNESEHTVQLMNRHWQITDGLGRRQDVKGAGVVGKQPVLKPGETFEYTSGTPLTTPSGIMAGSYEMEAETGNQFSVEIPAFSLDSPHQPVRLH
jgi:ApaG protein